MHMDEFKPKSFEIPNVQGISQRTIENHLELYQGYVDNTNHIRKELSEYDSDEDAAEDIAYRSRQIAFEFNGMKNHEIYFGHLVGGPSELPKDSLLEKEIVKGWGSFDEWLDEFRTLSMTRGTGWAVLWYDKNSDTLLNGWIDGQHIGQLQCAEPILMLDMWEHAYLMDHSSADKDLYVQAFFGAINWQSVSGRFDECHEEAEEESNEEPK